MVRFFIIFFFTIKKASEEDVSQVDPEFLNSPAIVDGAKVPETEQAKFAGFTYVKPE